MEKRTAQQVISFLVFALVAAALGIWMILTGSMWVGLAWIALGLVWALLALRAWRRANVRP